MKRPGVAPLGRDRANRARREAGSGARRRPATRSVPAARSGTYRHANDGREVRDQAQTEQHEDRENREVGAAGGESGDDTVMFVGSAGRGCVGFVSVAAGGAGGRFRVEEFMGLRIGRKPRQNPQKRHGQPSYALPKPCRAAAGAGELVAEKHQVAAHHTEVVKPPGFCARWRGWRPGCPPLTTLLQCSHEPMPTPAQLHKVNHLLTHVLAAAVARRWSQVRAGDCGETCTGFYGDFSFGWTPADDELRLLEGDMRSILVECRHFAHLEKTPAQATAFFAGNPYKLEVVETLAELDDAVGFYALDEFVDVCSCQIKELSELKAISPDAFALTGTTPALWRQGDKEAWLTRIHGVQAAALFGGRIGQG